MLRDFKYIIKRIIIGVGIALTLMFIKTNVFALQVSSYSIGTQYFGIDNSSTRIDYSITGNPWSVHANTSGYINFSFSLTKLTGSSTAPLAQPRGVSVSSGSNAYICNYGTVSSNNSTFNSQSYSVRCPVSMSSSGLTGITIVFQDFQSNDTSEYRVTLTSAMSYEIVENGNVSVNVDTSGTTSAINNQISNDNSNTQSIINNQDSNTQDIIDNQNDNTDREIESQKVCTTYDKSSGIQQGYFNSNGTINTSSSSSDYVITDFINITGAKLEALTSGGSNVRTCFFNTNKSFVSCINTISVGLLTIPTDATYVRFSIQKSNNRPTFKICQNGNQAIVNSQESINNTLNDDTVDTEQAGGFFNSFQTNSHGLSGIITSPLRLIQSLSSSQCSSLVLPLPFVNQSATIPCMSTVYSKFPTFYNLWQLITTGMIAYYILIKLFGHVKGMQNPNDDRIEVLNL